MKVRWTIQAADDLQSVHEHLNGRNPQAADALVEGILSDVETLERYIHLGRAGRIDGTRELVVTGTPIIVSYRLWKNQIEILGVLDAARKWPKEF